MKKFLSIALVIVGIIFCSQFADIPKVNAENYYFVGKYEGRDWYLNTDSIVITQRSPLCFSCLLYGKSAFEMYDMHVKSEFETRNDGTVYVTAHLFIPFTAEDTWALTNKDIHLINTYRYVLNNI